MKTVNKKTMVEVAVVSVALGLDSLLIAAAVSVWLVEQRFDLSDLRSSESGGFAIVRQECFRG